MHISVRAIPRSWVLSFHRVTRLLDVSSEINLDVRKRVWGCAGPSDFEAFGCTLRRTTQCICVRRLHSTCERNVTLLKAFQSHRASFALSTSYQMLVKTSCPIRQPQDPTHLHQTRDFLSRSPISVSPRLTLSGSAS